MEQEANNEVLIRNYLLGKLSESEHEVVEERLMTDREFSNFGLVVESMLVEDYLAGQLQGRDRENFKKLFLATPQGREQVRFTRELKEYASKAKACHWWQSTSSTKLWALGTLTILLIAAGIGL